MNVFVDAIEHVAEWLNQYGNAVNAVSTIITTAIAVSYTHLTLPTT